MLYKDNVIFRIEYKFPFYEKAAGTSNSRGNEIQIGIGVTG